FKLPNFLRRLFAEGAFNAGFVPMFARTLEGEGRAAAKTFAEQAQAIQLAVLVPLVLVTMAAMPWVIALMAPGFGFGSLRHTAAVEFSRITFVYILFIALVALYGGVLNSLGRFAAAAASPILLNLSLISALLIGALWFDAPADALAWGVAAGGLVQFLALRLALRRAAMAPALRRPRLTPQIKRLFALILPGAIGAGVAQINLFIDVVLASLLPTGAVSYLYFADRVSQLPLGVIGVAVGTALLPLMARQLRAGQVREAMYSQNRALELALLLTVPAALALVVLAAPIVSVLFERGAFGPEASRATSAALAAYALGLPAYVLVRVLTPGFFAREDTKTPVKIAIVCLTANVVMALALIWWLAHVGIALATALSAWLNVSLLARGLHRDDLLRPDARLRRRLPRILGASLAMALGLWLSAPWLDALAPPLALALLVAGGGLAFLVVGLLLGALDLGDLRRVLGRGRG
ncbi:MAG TPA: murein biosynthesis integral membrane protein MurJ, partial [Geminicoccaceae bacterium]|nr:murein biosynthesis integral membrane protein MurJ [Geminicoccaceae bacterium]